MQSKDKIEELTKNLPFGAKKRISQKTGLTQKTVINILKGRGGRTDTIKRVIKATKEELKEYDNLIKG